MPAVAARAWTLLLGSSAVYFFTTNEADNDLWGHVRFGRDIIARGAVPRVDTYSYTAAGHAWFDHEWLAQVTMASAYTHAGAAGLLMWKLGLATATCALLFAMMRRRTAMPELRGGLGLLTIAVLARGFAIRPQVVTYFAVALTLWLIDRYQCGRRRALWALPVLFLVWVNAHGGFVLGLAILGLFAGSECVRLRRPAAPPVLAFAASVATTVLNPYGIELLAYIWGELSRPHPITEWQPVAAGDVSQLVFFAMLGLFVVTLPFLRDWRTQGWQVVLALITGGLALHAQRHTAVFALCAVTPLTAQLDAAARWLRERSRFTLSTASHHTITTGVVGLALLQLVLTALRWQRDGLAVVFDPAEYPVAAVQALRRSGATVNLAVPLDWGEYVLWHLAPRVRVSLDGRFATVFPDTVVEDNAEFFTGERGARGLLDHYATEAALVSVRSVPATLRDAAWERIYADDVAEIYARRDRAAAMQLTHEPAAPAGIFP